MSSAQNYKDAQVLTIDGMGVSVLFPNVKNFCMLTSPKHTSGASLNLCGFQKISAYFQTNQMPGNGSFCPLGVGPFNIVLSGTLKDNIEQAGLSDLVAL